MRPQVALLSLLALLAAGVLAMAGCGGGGDSGSDASPQQLLTQTFGQDAAIKSGRLGIAVKADVKGSSALDARASARFQSATAKGQVPKFDGTVTIGTQGGSLKAGAISTGDAGYVTIAGASYKVSADDFAQLKKGYVADQQKSDSQQAKQPSLGALGIHPLDWLRDPRTVGEEQVGDAKTVHIATDVDVPKMVADVSKLIQRNGLSKQLSASQLKALQSSVKSAKVDVFTGKDDHRLRRIAIALTLDTGTIDLRIQYDDIDAPQQIQAPSGARPLSELTKALGQAGGAAGAGTGSGSGSGSGNARYTQCLQQAGTDLSKVQACAKYL